MRFKDIPIRKKLMRIIFLINGVVLLVTCVTFFVYEYYTFRKTSVEKLSTIGKIIAANSTAALAFDNQEDAKEILGALKTEPHIVAAALYDTTGKLFSTYFSGSGTSPFPVIPEGKGYRFIHAHLEGFEPVRLENRKLGTLYLKADLRDMYERLGLYTIIASLVIIISLLLAYLLSKISQRSISKPILDLAATAKIVSGQRNYSVRAVKTGHDEVGTLTEAFNHMLEQIQEQNQSLSEFNQTLEQKVKERTGQLVSLNREMEAFSYSISHDLRAPLRAIIGFTTILEEDYSSKLDAEARRITTVIKSNTMKMGNLIDDLLSFSRAGRQDIVKSSVNMDVLSKEVIDSLSSQFTMAKIHWNKQALPTVQADMNTIRQVWVNLISNAIKYSGKQETQQISIGSFRKEDQTVFFIKDNGVGFDEKHKGKLFNVFQRLHSADEFEGTGVGLALVEKIVSKHGGHVWAEGELNKGASFYFSLPDENKLGVSI